MAIKLDLEIFESLVSGARAEYLDRVRINFGKLDEGELVKKLNNTSNDQWSETQLKGHKDIDVLQFLFLK